MRRLVVMAAGIWLASGLLGRCGCAGDAARLRLATFNIEKFPHARTDLDRVAARLADIDADLVAVQEIDDVAALRRVMADASDRTGRDYRLSASPYCRHANGWVLGVIYDRARVELIDERPLGTPRRCRADHPSGHAVVARVGDRRLVFGSVHLKALPQPENVARRRGQWRQLIASHRRLERELGLPVVIAGDFNTTGFRTDGGGERSYIERMVDAYGLDLLTAELPCTAYWRPPSRGGRLGPSVLDHILVRGGNWAAPEPRGMCAELACAPVDGDEPVDYHRVSDHCPVVVDAR